MKYLVILGVAAVAFAAPAMADGDPAAGASVFNKCKACHENEKGVNRVGPTLKGIVGRKTASIPDFNYSDAMKAKGAEGQVWDEATLKSYLPDPKAWVPGTKMVFPGLKVPKDVDDVIAFLKTKP